MLHNTLFKIINVGNYREYLNKNIFYTFFKFYYKKKFILSLEKIICFIKFFSDLNLIYKFIWNKYFLKIINIDFKIYIINIV